MKFDTLVIGGGVAGLTAAIRCAEAGQKTAVISAGQSAMHFSSGSIDVLSHVDQKPVRDPFAAFADLKKSSPSHPYTHLGVDGTKLALNWFSKIMLSQGIELSGQEDGTNHFRITPMGTFRSTWLSQGTVHQFPFSDIASGLNTIALVTLDGFRDFQPQLAADNLAKLPHFANVSIKALSIELPDTDDLQRNPCEFRSIDISRLIQDDHHLERFAEVLTKQVGRADLVLLPSIFGNGVGVKMLKRLETLTGYRLCELPTMPPSLIGIRIEDALKAKFKALGGLLLPGDEVVSGDIVDGKLARIYTKKHEDMPFHADNFILTTGSFFSHGLRAERQEVSEPIFNLDLAAHPARDNWYHPQFFNSEGHPFLKMGVATDSNWKPSVNGQTVSNLYCAGSILAHYDPVSEGCGSGVAIATGFHAAEGVIASQATNKNNNKEVCS